MRRAPLLPLVCLLAVAQLGGAPPGVAQSGVTQSGADPSRPPQDLRLVGDHWTAWSPPLETPPGAEVHVIERGDTLWDLAERFYGDPYLWPQLWDRNRYILDAHWIYPGDPLLVGVEVAPLDELAEAPEPAPPVAEPPPGEGEFRFDTDLGPPVPLGSEDDIYCSGFIAEPDLAFGYHIIGSEAGNLAPSLDLGAAGTGLGKGYGVIGSVKVGHAPGDIVYVDGGRVGGLGPGEEFTIVEPAHLVDHPRERRRIGRFYRYQGRLRILSVQERTAIAEITHGCHPILVGTGLLPFEPEPIPLGRLGAMRPPNLPPRSDDLADSATIVDSEAGLVSLGQDHLVFIDRGSGDDLTPGDLLTIYRPNPRDLPPLVVGELAVLSVRAETALAKIVRSRHIVFVGDVAELK